MDHHFYPLTIKAITPEATDAYSVCFEVPESLKETFQYKQGQHLTLRFQLKGEEVRRAYSMSSSPLEKDLTITIKRVKNGLVSNYIIDQLKPGAQVDVMPPQGRFFTPLRHEQQKTYYLFGAGSGITPLISIIKTALEAEPMSTFYLLFGNRNEGSIIFREQLAQLALRYEGQLYVDHILSQPEKQKASGLGGLFKKAVTAWDGKTGRIDAHQVQMFLDENHSRNKEKEYFICGPGNMIDSVQQALETIGIDKKHIHSEHFLSSLPHPSDNALQKGASANIKVELDGQVIQATVQGNKTILETLIALKYDPPYSCTSGSCSTCMARVTKGKVKMDVCYALDPDEVEQGYILTCQSHPITEEVELTYMV